jgi:D-citramalate synthase
MSKNISPDKIWTSELNRTDDILSRFDRSTPVRFYDTTLRDGEQSVGVCFTPEEKFDIACRLSELGVGRIESGFPRVSADDTAAVRRILDAGLQSEIWGFSRAVKADVDAHIELGTEHVLIEISTSDMKIKAYGFTRDSVLQRVTDAIRHAKDNGIKTVNFFAVDSTRSDLGFLRDVYSTAIEEGADEVSVVDTIGVCSPEAVERLIGEVSSWVGPDVPIHWHGHNDFGMATASAVAAVRGGARWIQGTINGMGERAGNTPLDEVVVGIHDFLGRRTHIDETKLITASERVEVFSGRRVSFNKPIVGPNVFTQTAGIHADGDHKGDLYASRLSPERFARRRRYALGKLSGKRSLEFNLADLGIVLDDEQSRLVLERIKELADRKQTITQDDLPFIISDVLETPHDREFILRRCIVVSSIGLKPIATIKLARRNGTGEFDEYEASDQGDGGYDAFMNAVRSIARKLNLSLPRLADYNVSIPPGGKSDALVQCSITWTHPDRPGEVFNTKGVHSDQVLAAAQATEKMLNLVAAGAPAAVHG